MPSIACRLNQETMRRLGIVKNDAINYMNRKAKLYEEGFGDYDPEVAREINQWLKRELGI